MDKNRKQADYSLLIVDDEELIRTGMKYGIHWEKAGNRQEEYAGYHYHRHKYA